MTGGVSRHREELGLTHYHVIAENHDGELIYSDGFTLPGAEGFAADLIAPPASSPIYEPVKAVWIIPGEPLRCPLAHGDGIPEDEQAAHRWLEQSIQQRPYWSA